MHIHGHALRGWKPHFPWTGESRSRATAAGKMPALPGDAAATYTIYTFYTAKLPEALAEGLDQSVFQSARPRPWGRRTIRPRSRNGARFPHHILAMRCVWLRDHSQHMPDEDESPCIVIVGGKVRIHLSNVKSSLYYTILSATSLDAGEWTPCGEAEQGQDDFEYDAIGTVRFYKASVRDEVE